MIEISVEYILGEQVPGSNGPGGQMDQRCLDSTSHYEEERYRRAFLSLMEKVRHSDDAEIRELYKSIRKPRSLSAAVHEALDKYS